MQQRTDEWMRARAGQFTASRSAALMARTKSGPSSSRAELITTLAIERLTGVCVDNYTTGPMRRGIDLEPLALAAYITWSGMWVEEEAYIASADLPNTGCSPDGLVGEDGLVEVKCPANAAKHVAALRSGAHAVEYRWQLQHQMMVCGRQWNDAISFDPRFPGGLQMAITRVQRDEAAIAELRAAIIAADDEVTALVLELSARRWGRP
jgi:putative phage-type endonuclease